MKPSYSYNEMLALIWMCETREEIHKLEFVLWEERNRYGLCEMCDLLSQIGFWITAHA